MVIATEGKKCQFEINKIPTGGMEWMMAGGAALGSHSVMWHVLSG